MKKRLFLRMLLVPILSISSCSLKGTAEENQDNEPTQQQNQNSNNSNGNNNSNPSYSNEFTYENLLSAYRNTLKQSSLTINFETVFTSENSYLHTDDLGYIDEVAKCVTTTSSQIEIDGNNSFLTSNYEEKKTVSISLLVEKTGLAIEEIKSIVKSHHIQFLSNNYFTDDTVIDETNQTVVISETNSDSRYSVYDEDAKQSYSFYPGEYYSGSNFEYDIYDNSPLSDIEEMIGEVTNSVIRNGKLYLTIFDEEYEVEASFHDNLLNRIHLTYSDDTYEEEWTITFSKINETTVTLPQYHPAPFCFFNHDENTPYEYIRTETGHRKICAHCWRFLNEREIPHGSFYDTNHVCDKCGYISGWEEQYSYVPEGFENDSNQGAYALIYVKNGIEYGPPSFSSWDISGIYVDGDSYGIVYFEDNAIIVYESHYSDVHSFEGATCLTYYPGAYTLYKNVPEAIITYLRTNFASNDDEEEALNALQSSISQLTVTKRVDWIDITESHDVEETDPISLNNCVSYKKAFCTLCGEVTNFQICSTDYHFSAIAHSQIDISECEHIDHYTCTACGEEIYDGWGYHNPDKAIFEETQIDACHKLATKRCGDCGEEITYSREVIENHTGGQRNVEIVMNDCVTKVLTICEGCNMILDTNYVSNHLDVTHVICSFDEFENYGVDYLYEVMDQNNPFVFDYCNHCSDIVNWEILEYYQFEMDHAHSGLPCKVHYLDRNGSQSTYYEIRSCQHFMENGMCRLCGCRIYELSDTFRIEATCKENPEGGYYWNLRYYDSETDHFMYLDNFYTHGDQINITDPESPYRQINVYEGTSYPGIAILQYIDEFGNTLKYEYQYNNKTQTGEITPQQFGL